MAGCMNRRSGYLTQSAHLTLLLLLFVCLLQISRQATGSKLQVIQVLDGQQFAKTGPHHFCYINNIVPGWRQTWTRIQVRVWSSKQLEVTIAEDEERLQELEAFSFWGLVKTFIQETSNETTVPVSLFCNKTCFKIHPADASALYTVKPFRKFDVYLFVVFLAGVLLFSFAESMSRSQVFYYSAGMSTGLIASLVILIFIMARLMPKKSPFYVLIVGGWSFSLYIIQLVFKNLQVILKDHWHLALGYTAVVGFVSFAVCYRHGPLVEERSINILSWTLQLFGLLLVYAGIQVQQVAFAVMLAALCAKNLQLPLALGASAWRRVRPALGFKPGPRRLLTEEEYQKQGEEETRRALEDLRRFCSSPEASPWRTVSRLETPKRFADFVEGSPHLRSNEVSVHAQEYGFGGAFFEDELFSTDEDEEEEGDIIKPLSFMQGD